MSSKKKILLLQDVYNLGRSGDVSVVARGYGNYLIWKGDAVFADKFALKRQAKLKEDREIRAANELEEAKLISEKLSSISITIPVKVDQDGNMYGSVNTNDLADLLSKENISIDKKRICTKAIKETGSYSIKVKLNEGIEGCFSLKIVSENAIENSVSVSNE